MTRFETDWIVDSDVRCAVPGPDVLRPYLPTHWDEYFDESAFRATPGPAQVYPSWSNVLATKGAEITLETVQQNVLTRAGSCVLNCYYGVESVTQVYFAEALATAVNRWVAAEWLDQDDRLFASATITPHYTDGAVAEINRIANDRRFVQVLLPTRASEPYGSHRYWPIWDAAAEHGLALALNPSGSAGTPPTPTGWPASFAEEYSAAPIAFQTHVVSLIVSGIFQRHPNLRVVVLESGCTWLPALMWRMDLEWKSARREAPWLTEPPSSYVRRHFRFTTQPFDAPSDPAQRAEIIGQLGSDEMLMFASAYPHRYEAGQDELLDLLNEEQIGRCLGGNARDTYALESRRLNPITSEGSDD